MSGNILSRFDFAQQFRGVAANAASIDFNDLDFALGVDHEGAALGQASFLNHHTKVASDGAGWVADHRVLDLADGVGAVVPGFVGEVGIGGDGVDLYAQFLEFRVVVRQVAQFGGADKGEVSRVEEEHRPLALKVRLGQVYKFALIVSLGTEGFDFRIDGCHESHS